MRRIIIQDRKHIHPFNEAARDLRVQNVPLWLWQRDLFGNYTNEEREYSDLAEALKFERGDATPSLVHRDSIFFNHSLIKEFVSRAQAGDEALRLAFSLKDPAISEHVLPLTKNIEQTEDYYLGELWYLPNGLGQIDYAKPLVVDTESREVGYYHIPHYMATPYGDLVYQLPRKAFVSIESWVHLFIVDILFGLFAHGKRIEEKVESDWRYRLRILFRSMIEQKRVLDCSELVSVGENVSIDPTAIIHGPTTIGNNVTIGPGVVIDNCVIGDNVNIAQGCQLMLSIVSDGCFLPFNAALFMTTLMENTIVAQNACLQLCVIGRDSFIGAGTTFTDYKLLPGAIYARADRELLDETNLRVLGGCVGHHCRLSSGLVIYPARTIESDVVLLAGIDGQVVTDDVYFEDSSHHKLSSEKKYSRKYPRMKE
jgi:carbonic anhydrase/acetyltransferase-like protein (isoleucine patch superfamily)